MNAGQGGDRRMLTAMELSVLEGTILPTAHRWLRVLPQLAHHAVNTLAFWGEPLEDDYGNPFKGNGRRAGGE